MNIQNIARVNFKQQSFNVLQEKLNFANVRNTLICQDFYVYRFWASKSQGFSVNCFCTLDH